MLSIFLMLVALASAPILLLALDRRGIEKTIANSRNIEAQFRAAAAFVDEFRATNHKFPSPDEFDAWTSQDKAVRKRYPLMLQLGPFEAEITAQAGTAPPDGYVIAYWRGEWMERYFSWNKRSTLQFDPDAYFLFHSQWAQMVLAVVGVLFSVTLAIWCWPRRRGSRRTCRHSK